MSSQEPFRIPPVPDTQINLVRHVLEVRASNAGLCEKPLSLAKQICTKLVSQTSWPFLSLLS